MIRNELHSSFNDYILLVFCIWLEVFVSCYLFWGLLLAFELNKVQRGKAHFDKLDTEISK